MSCNSYVQFNMLAKLDLFQNLLSVNARANFFQMQEIADDAYSGEYMLGGDDAACREICRADAGMRFWNRSIQMQPENLCFRHISKPNRINLWWFVSIFMAHRYFCKARL